MKSKAAPSKPLEENPEKGYDRYPRPNLQSRPVYPFEEILENQRFLNEKMDAIKAGNLPFKWLDIPETCKILKISPRTLQTYRDESRLGFSQIGSKIYFKLEDLEDFLNRHYVTAIK